MSQPSNQAGKGMTPRKGYNPRAYRDNWEAAFKKPITCDICGRFISYDELEDGRATRYLEEPDSDYSSETFATYHTACRAKGH